MPFLSLSLTRGSTEYLWRELHLQVMGSGVPLTTGQWEGKVDLEEETQVVLLLLPVEQWKRLEEKEGECIHFSCCLKSGIKKRQHSVSNPIYFRGRQECTKR